MCRLACGAPDPARQGVVRATLIEAMDRWLPREVRSADQPIDRDPIAAGY
jgi:hypothetical protein